MLWIEQTREHEYTVWEWVAPEWMRVRIFSSFGAARQAFPQAFWQ